MKDTINTTRPVQLNDVELEELPFTEFVILSGGVTEGYVFEEPHGPEIHSQRNFEDTLRFIDQFRGDL